MRKPLALFAAALLATSLAAGCGGDDGGDDEESTDQSVDGGAGTDSPDSTGDTSSTTATTVAVGGDVAAGSEDFCTAAAAFANDPSLQNSEFTPEATENAVGLLTNLRDAAPEEIQDDLQVVIDGYSAIAEAMTEAGDDPEAQQEAVTALADQFQSLSAASDAVQQYTQENCGLDVTGTTVAEG